jgi:hypothetical protein
VIGCDEALEAAMLRAAGDIDLVTRERLESHLLVCAACEAEVGRIRETIQLMRAGETPEPGAGYWRSFDARLRGRILRARSVRRWGDAASLAAAAAGAFLGLWIWNAAYRASPAPATPGGSSVARADQAADAAEARLEETINRLALEEQGERSFETILDEVMPANSPGYDVDLEKPENEPLQTQDRI